MDDPNFTGTACCTLGPLSVSPGETLVYEFRDNFSPSNVTWEVISGSITIVSGENSAEATLKFGDDFNGGRIVAYGSAINEERGCSEVIDIVKK